MIEQEIWRDIPGYSGVYQASQLGNIRVKDRVLERIRKGTTVRYTIKGHILKPYLNKGGYYVVPINGRPVSAHRLIAQTFIKYVYGKPYVNHLNSIRTDNRVENLEWCTQRENIEHASRMGRKISRQRQLEARDIKMIKELYKKTPHTMTQKDLAWIFNVAQPTICDILNGKLYKQIAQ